MNNNSIISLFKSVTDASPSTEITIYQFIENVIQCDYINEIETIRAEPDKAKRSELKKKLPCATISGTFSKRGNQYLIKHSGFLCIDIDASENPTINDWEAFRDSLATWSIVLFSALSISGNGVFLIIPIAEPKKHTQHFLALEAQFKEFGIIIDKQCKDITRLRLISNDPQAVYNPQAEPYRRIVEPKHPRPFKNHTAPPELNKLIQWVERKHGSFITGNRNNYITQLAGVCHRLNISQIEVENHCTHLQQTDFTEHEILSIIKSIYSNSAWKAKAII